jgi:HPt (histidine-containing phosphotransfer) domain-containing protein
MLTDLSYLKGMTGGNPEVIKEMVNIFIEQVSEISESMDKALSEKNYIVLSKLSHKAKASVSIMGMNDLAATLKEFELKAAESKEIELYPTFVDKFKNDCALAVEELYSNIKTE